MADQDFHIVFAESFDPDAVERARAIGRVTLLDACDEAALIGAVADCDALLVRTASRVSRRVIERANRLRVIGRAGVGLDSIDVEAAHERGIQVVYTPSAATDAVADLTIGLMISALRKISVGDARVRADKFDAGRQECIGPELRTLTIGIIGLGRIGQAVAQRCHRGFGMTVLFHDIADVKPDGFSATPVTMDDLLTQADVVSLHVPLTELTRGMINAPTLAQCKRGAILINTSRGAVVVAGAVADALRSGLLGGAAFDVFDREPLLGDHPLMTAPNTILTPHIGARAPAALARMNAVVDDVLGVLRGEAPRFPAQ